MKASQVSRQRPQHICVFGDPKTGKSTLAAKLLLQGFHLHWVSMDNGHEVLFKMGLSEQELEEQLDVYILPDTKEFPVAIKTCRKIMSGRPQTICDQHGEVDCMTCKRNTAASWSTIDVSKFGPMDILVFDHLGQLANSAMTAVFFKAKKSVDEDKAEWEDYARQGFLMDGFLTNVQQAKFNIICITHICESEMEDGKKKLVPLVGTTNFSRNSAKYFDHVIYLSMVNATHRYGSATTYMNNVVLGSRSDKLIEKEKEPTLRIFFDGTIPPPELAGASAAKKLLTKPEVVKMEAAFAEQMTIEGKVEDAVSLRVSTSDVPVDTEKSTEDALLDVEPVRGGSVDGDTNNTVVTGADSLAEQASKVVADTSATKAAVAPTVDPGKRVIDAAARAALLAKLTRK